MTLPRTQGGRETGSPGRHGIVLLHSVDLSADTFVYSRLGWKNRRSQQCIEIFCQEQVWISLLLEEECGHRDEEWICRISLNATISQN